MCEDGNIGEPESLSAFWPGYLGLRGDGTGRPAALLQLRLILNKIIHRSVLISRSAVLEFLFSG